MKEKIANLTFSLTALSLAVGALGFISGFVTLFIDTSLQLSIKWLLLAVWLSVTFVLVLLKVIYDQDNEKRPAPPYEVPIQYRIDTNILVIRRNDNFLNNIIVGCYIREDEVDSLACLGVVHIVQDNLIQIKLR